MKRLIFKHKGQTPTDDGKHYYEYHPSYFSSSISSIKLSPYQLYDLLFTGLTEQYSKRWQWLLNDVDVDIVLWKKDIKKSSPYTEKFYNNRDKSNSKIKYLEDAFLRYQKVQGVTDLTTFFRTGYFHLFSNTFTNINDFSKGNHTLGMQLLEALAHATHQDFKEKYRPIDITSKLFFTLRDNKQINEEAEHLLKGFQIDIEGSNMEIVDFNNLLRSYDKIVSKLEREILKSIHRDKNVIDEKKRKVSIALISYFKTTQQIVAHLSKKQDPDPSKLLKLSSKLVGAAQKLASNLNNKSIEKEQKTILALLNSDNNFKKRLSQNIVWSTIAASIFTAARAVIDYLNRALDPTNPKQWGEFITSFIIGGFIGLISLTLSSISSNLIKEYLVNKEQNLRIPDRKQRQKMANVNLKEYNITIKYNNERFTLHIIAHNAHEAMLLTKAILLSTIITEYHKRIPLPEFESNSMSMPFIDSTYLASAQFYDQMIYKPTNEITLSSPLLKHFDRFILRILTKPKSTLEPLGMLTGPTIKPVMKVLTSLAEALKGFNEGTSRYQTVFGYAYLLNYFNNLPAMQDLSSHISSLINKQKVISNTDIDNFIKKIAITEGYNFNYHHMDLSNTTDTTTVIGPIGDALHNGIEREA
jgi:hypothetical protein